jgi:putative transposase
VSELVGAAHGERAPEERLTHRNGYRSRVWQTRAGELELAIPKIRRGSYFPSFLEPPKRSEQALVSVVQEAYVAGVSTRKVDQVVESLGLRISKSEVSRICQGLDEQVDAFRNRPLEAATRTCGWTRRSRRSATAAAWSGRHWCSRTGCTSPATGR